MTELIQRHEAGLSLSSGESSRQHGPAKTSNQTSTASSSGTA